MKIAMISLSSLCMYAGRRIKPGDEFEVNGASDARVLIAIGRADFAPARVEPEPATSYGTPVARKWTRAIQAEAHSVVDAATAAAIDAAVLDSAPPDEEAPAPKPKRQYKRRDMSAED